MFTIIRFPSLLQSDSYGVIAVRAFSNQRKAIHVAQGGTLSELDDATCRLGDSDVAGCALLPATMGFQKGRKTAAWKGTAMTVPAFNVRANGDPSSHTAGSVRHPLHL